MAALIAVSQSYAAKESIDTLKTYELQNVQVTSTRAGKHTPMAFSTLNKDQIKKINLKTKSRRLIMVRIFLFCFLSRRV